jgi:hypothetical protein
MNSEIMMHECQELIGEHQALQKQLADQPDTVEIERVRHLIAQVRDAGAYTEDPQQRERLRAILKHWGAYFYEQMGELPSTQLMPYEPRRGLDRMTTLRIRVMQWWSRRRRGEKVAWVGAFAIVVLALSFFGVELATKSLSRPTPTIKPAELCNGGFEDIFDCWQHGGELDQVVECDGSQCFAVLGNPHYACEGGVPVGEAWMKQSFKVPQTVSPTLSLRYRIFSHDLDSYDFFQVSIDGDPVFRDGNTEWNVSSCDGEVWDSGERPWELDLSPYIGKRIELSLHNVNGEHEWYNTWTYVDDVEVR